MNEANYFESVQLSGLKGYKNSGWDNTGSLNSGNGNSGDYNNGSYNSGHRNYGSFNSGDYNTGDNNSGDWNTANGSNGVFCTVSTNVCFFNQPTGMCLEDWRKSKAYQILSRARTTKWVPRASMSLAERLCHREYKLQGGYLKKLSLNESCLELWAQLTADEKYIITSMPNFDPGIFRTITGISMM